MSYRVLWTVRSPFSGADGSFYCLPLFCACKALKIKDLSAPNCPHKTSFSVHFLFSAACELWRHSWDSISPGWTLGRTRCRRPHSVLAPYPGKSLFPASRFAARPNSGTTYSRLRKKWSGGRCGCPHRQGAYSSRPHSCSTPGGSGVCLFPLCRCHAVKGTVLLALYGRQSFIWVLSHVFPPFFLCRSPRKGFLPHSCGVFQRWHAPRTSGHFVPKWLVAVLPLPRYSFSDGHSFFKVQLIDELP